MISTVWFGGGGRMFADLTEQSFPTKQREWEREFTFGSGKMLSKFKGSGSSELKEEKRGGGAEELGRV